MLQIFNTTFRLPRHPSRSGKGKSQAAPNLLILPFREGRRLSGGVGSRGMALVATMLVLFSVMTIMLIGGVANTIGASTRGNGLLGMTGNSTQSSSARMNSAVAFNLAESGVEYTLEWLSLQAAPPNPNGNWSAFAPTLWGATSTGSPPRAVVPMIDPSGATVGSFSIEVYPDSTNPGNTQKRYIIESVGTSGGMTETLRVVAAQKSFGGYGYFNDVEVSNGYWVAGMNQFDGPMHSNNSTPSSSSWTNTNILWHAQTTPPPMFTWHGNDAFTCSAPTINWYKGSLSTLTSPSTNADWLEVASGGASGIHTGTPKIPLPTASTLQLTAALGAGTVPSSTGVLVPSSGGKTTAGIYIHGAVDNMVLSVDGSGNQVITISQHDATYSPITNTITLNTATGQTQTSTAKKTISTGVTTTTTANYTSLTNGVIYCDASIGVVGSSSVAGKGLSGTIANNTYSGSTVTRYNALTIATANNGSIYLNGSIKYATARATSGGALVPESQDTNFTLKAGILGLVSNNLEVVENDINNAHLTNVEVDAAAMSYNTFDATNPSTRPTGTFNLMGSYVAGTAGFFGTINSSGTLLNGFAENYHFDARLADTPPPYYPTTGNVYDVGSWQRVSSTLQ